MAVANKHCHWQEIDQRGLLLDLCSPSKQAVAPQSYAVHLRAMVDNKGTLSDEALYYKPRVYSLHQKAWALANTNLLGRS
jgi:hypothetical protein